MGGGRGRGIAEWRRGGVGGGRGRGIAEWRRGGVGGGRGRGVAEWWREKEEGERWGGERETLEASTDSIEGEYFSFTSAVLGVHSSAPSSCQS